MSTTTGPDIPGQAPLDAPGLPPEEGVEEADIEAGLDEDPEEMPNATDPEAHADQAGDHTAASSAHHPEDS